MTTKNSNEAQIYSAAKAAAATHSSAIPKFHELTVHQRQDVIGIYANLTDNEVQLLSNTFLNAEDVAWQNKKVENCIARNVGVGLYFKINGKDRIVPMETKEQSVIAAASNGAKRSLIAGS